LRTLKFIVDGQTISKDPRCDFSGIFPGTENYIRAEFSFSPEWNNRVKVASFYSVMGREYPPRVLTNNACMVPAEALARRQYKLQIIGKGPDGSKISTEKITIEQNGGN
jgi:hypothetical protein